MQSQCQKKLIKFCIFADEMPPTYPGGDPFSETKRHNSHSQPPPQIPELPPKNYQSAHSSAVNNIASAVSRLTFSQDNSNGHSSGWSNTLNSSYPEQPSSTNSKYNYNQPNHQAYPSQASMMPTGISPEVLSHKLGQIQDSYPNQHDEEPMVPSYPHYVKGSRQHETQIQSKSYELTAPRRS